jgi:hypothetical protein
LESRDDKICFPLASLICVANYTSIYIGPMMLLPALWWLNIPGRMVLTRFIILAKDGSTTED